MKKWVRALLAAAAALFLFSACSGGGTAPTYTSEQVDGEVSELSTDLQALQQETSNDPAVASLMQLLQNYTSTLPLSSLSLHPATLLNVTSFNPQKLVPLLDTVELLPRSGFNTVTGDEFTPNPPTDYELIVQTGDTTYMDLKVDWDRSPTVDVTTRAGAIAERPTSSEAELYLGKGVSGNELLEPTLGGSAELTASWYRCSVTPTEYIEEPTAFAFAAQVGVQSKLRLEADYSLREGSTDTYTASLVFSGDAPSGSFEQRLEVSASGDLQRIDCWTTDFDLESATVSFSTRATRDSRTKSLEFSVTFDRFSYDADGNLTSVDIDGKLKINGAVAAVFGGRLDDLDQSCPGAHVQIQFADRTTTLSDWLQSNGYCATSLASF